MPNDMKAFVMPKGIPTPVQELVLFLKDSGTGQAKLYRIADLGRISKNAKEFIAAVEASVPPGTWKKVKEFVDSKNPNKQDKVAKIAAPAKNHPLKTLFVEEDDEDEIVGLSTPEDSEASQGVQDQDTDTSPLLQFSVPEAVELIKEMEDVDKLETIILTDSRKGVIHAATERLKKLGG